MTVSRLSRLVDKFDDDPLRSGLEELFSLLEFDGDEVTLEALTDDAGVFDFDRVERFNAVIGTLSPNNSAFKTEENVMFASCSFLISISLSTFLVVDKSGKIS
jgi:hypothetical protein